MKKAGKTLKNLLYTSIIAGAGLVGCVPEPDIDIIPPKITIYSPEKDQTYSGNVSLDYMVEEDNFKNAWYSINDGAKTGIPQSGMKNLDLSNGNYKIVVGAEDKSFNSSKDSSYFSVDKPIEPQDTIAPKISVSEPLESKVYESNTIPFKGNAEDENLSNVNYTLNGGSKINLPNSWSQNLDLQNGNYRLIVNAKDSKGNSNADTIDFKVEKPTWKYLVNPFVQPNDSTLNWYGSGDVNNDNIVNWEDYNSMNILSNDQSDIDGDGIPSTSNDKQILEGKLMGTREYLPGNWNKLRTKSERESWLQKMLEIDKTDTMAYIPGESVCTDFAIQLAVNFSGYGELGYEESKGLKDNGRFNIPVYYVSVIPQVGFGHAINTTITGDNLQEFIDGFYSEPQADYKVTPGMWDMPLNCEVEIKYMYTKENEIQGKYLSSTPILKFQIINGVPELSWENDDPNVKIIKNR